MIYEQKPGTYTQGVRGVASLTMRLLAAYSTHYQIVQGCACVKLQESCLEFY